MSHLFTCFLLCLLIFPFAVFAQDNRMQVQQYFQEDANITAQDLGIKEPRLLMGDILYPFKQFARNLSVFLTFNKEKKLKKEEKILHEQVMEIRKMIAKEYDEARMRKAFTLYKRQLDRVSQAYESIPEDKKDAFRERMLEMHIKHQMIFERLEHVEDIKELREKHMKRMQFVLDNENQENNENALRQIMMRMKGSPMRDMYQLHMLVRLEEQTGHQQMKELFMNERGNAFYRLQAYIESQNAKDMKNIIDQYVSLMTQDDVSYIDFMGGLRRSSSQSIRPLFDELEMEKIKRLETKLQENPQLREKIQEHPRKRMMLERLPIQRFENN